MTVDIPSSHISYKNVGEEMMIHTIGATKDMVFREARSGVIRVCRDTNILQKTEKYDWAADGQYVMSHEGFSFDQILGVWFNEALPQNRLDGNLYQDLTIGLEETIMQLNGFGLNAPEGSRNRDVYNIPEQVVINYSYTPGEESISFPLLVWRQYRHLIITAGLAKMWTYIRDDNRGRKPDYEATYMQLLKGARPRLSAMPGPDRVESWFGGFNDFYGTSQGGGGSDW